MRAQRNPTQLRQVHRPEMIENSAQCEKQRTFHQGVVEQVQDAGGQAGERRKTNSQYHVADLGDTGVGQHAFDVVLEDGHCRGAEYRQ